MPLYDYGCKNEECKHEWEVQHKLADSGPSECPKCGHKDVGKLLSAVRGSVELTGQELTAKIKSDAKKINLEAQTNERMCANLVGENKYNANVSAIDKARKDIGKD